MIECRLSFLETQKGQNLDRGCKGSGNPSTAPKWRQMGIMGAIYLTAIYGVADNKGLFWGSGKSPRLNQFGLSMASKGTLVAEVFA